MAKEFFEKHRFRPEDLKLIDQVEKICEEYSDLGFVLTLRQAYYQCVAKNLIPNKDAAYKRLGKLVGNARLAGLLDWDMFEDRTRNYLSLAEYANVGDCLQDASWSYHIDWWKGQSAVPEVWVEKQALENIIDQAATEFDVGYFCCRGYVSLSEMHVASKRIIRRKEETGRNTVILYLGDHDPSGYDMHRDVEDRLVMFGANLRRQLTVKRIALNMNQIREHEMPPNPAKMTDSRSGKYVEMFGENSWELDAMDATVMNDLIQKHIKWCINDPDQWALTKEKEEKGRAQIRRIARDYRDEI